MVFSKPLPFPRRPWVGLILAEAPPVGLHLPLCGMNRKVSSETLSTQTSRATREESRDETTTMKTHGQTLSSGHSEEDQTAPH